MELVRERQTIELTNAEAQKHNAQISERYRLLQMAEADQFSQQMPSQPVQERVVVQQEAPSFVMEETPVVEQAPQVTEFIRERILEPVFTAEKFEMAGLTEETVAKEVVEPIVEHVIRQETQKSTEVAAHYSLSALAKVVMAAFVMVVIALLSLIAYNSQVINQKRIKINNLEEKRDQLIEQYEEIQSRIAIAESEETILEWAQSQGMVPLAS